MNFEVNKINTLKKHHQKIFIIIGGASASGKNYFANQLNFPIIDIDEINKRLNNGKVNCRETVSKSLLIVKKEMLNNFENGKSFIQVTTASTLKGTENKFKLAKKYNYFTIFIHIKTISLRQLYINNEKRVLSGGHGATIPKWKFLLTKTGSEIVFNTLKNSNWVDFTLQVYNKGF